MTLTQVPTANISNLNVEGSCIHFVNIDGKIYFTKKELATIYKISKDVINVGLENDTYKKIKVGDTVKKFHSIDSVIILGYKLRRFKETRSLTLLQRYIKLGGLQESLLTRMKRLCTDLAITKSILK